MRILNRPMFRYGGPIKEGVMHGMRNGGRAALVGNPVYPRTDGREHHFTWKSIFGLGTKALKKKPIVPVQTKPSMVGSGWQKIKELFTGKQVPVKIPMGGTGSTTGQVVPYGSGVNIGTRTTFNPMGTPGTNQWLYGGAQRILTPVTGGLATAGKYGWGKVKPYTGALTIAGVTYSLLKPDGTPKTVEELKEETGASEKELNTAAKVIDPNAAAKLAKDAQNKRLKSYLDMMGYDRSKKTAMSDALIDASALVQDATTEAGSIKHADWGKLINKMIQTTSKRYDKPEQIREAVGLMMTKGAIEKDIAAEKGTQYDVKEKYLVGKLGQVAGERAALQKPSSLSEAVNLTKATDTTGNRTNQALRHYYDGYLVPSFEGKISKKKIDALGGDKVFEEGMKIGLGDGVYQISNGYIIVQGNKIIERDDVFATEN